MKRYATYNSHESFTAVQFRRLEDDGDDDRGPDMEPGPPLTDYLQETPQEEEDNQCECFGPGMFPSGFTFGYGDILSLSSSSILDPLKANPEFLFLLAYLKKKNSIEYETWNGCQLVQDLWNNPLYTNLSMNPAHILSVTAIAGVLKYFNGPLINALWDYADLDPLTAVATITNAVADNADWLSNLKGIQTNPGLNGKIIIVRPSFCDIKTWWVLHKGPYDPSLSTNVAPSFPYSMDTYNFPVVGSVWPDVSGIFRYCESKKTTGEDQTFNHVIYVPAFYNGTTRTDTTNTRCCWYLTLFQDEHLSQEQYKSTKIALKGIGRVYWIGGSTDALKPDDIKADIKTQTQTIPPPLPLPPPNNTGGGNAQEYVLCQLPTSVWQVNDPSKAFDYAYFSSLNLPTFGIHPKTMRGFDLAVNASATYQIFTAHPQSVNLLSNTMPTTPFPLDGDANNLPKGVSLHNGDGYKFKCPAVYIYAKKISGYFTVQWRTNIVGSVGSFYAVEVQKYCDHTGTDCISVYKVQPPIAVRDNGIWTSIRIWSTGGGETQTPFSDLWIHGIRMQYQDANTLGLPPLTPPPVVIPPVIIPPILPPAASYITIWSTAYDGEYSSLFQFVNTYATTTPIGTYLDGDIFPGSYSNRRIYAPKMNSAMYEKGMYWYMPSINDQVPSVKWGNLGYLDEAEALSRGWERCLNHYDQWSNAATIRQIHTQDGNGWYRRLQSQGLLY